ncbi:MAG: ACT domain-containing protein [Abditibacteriales bacterium]|nr:ACT domain-containing protein [Abditibacteriales bacterium]MDW8365213.1 ACT domain-containing protein [Abditibacteriales bacterium]
MPAVKPSLLGIKEPVEQERRVEQIVSTERVCHVTVDIAPRPLEAQVDAASVLETLDQAGIKISLLKIHQGFMDFIVEGDYSKRDLERVLQRPVQFKSNCAIVTLKSDSMRYLHGIMAAAVQALYNADIEVYETGDSYDSVSVVIDGKKLPRALKTLAQRFKVEAV